MPLKDKEKLREYQKEWQEKNKERISKEQRDKYANDNKYREARKTKAYESYHADKVKSRKIKKDQERERIRKADKRCLCGCNLLVNRENADYATYGCVPRKGSSKEQMLKISSMRDMDSLRIKLANASSKRIKQLKENGLWEAICKDHGDKLRGITAKGKGKKGLTNHIAAKLWAFRDPYGKMHIMSNLREWARNNTHLFNDDRPDSKLPFELRIAHGMKGALAKCGKVCSYKGWTAMSKSEIDEETRDLLGRDEVDIDYSNSKFKIL